MGIAIEGPNIAFEAAGIDVPCIRARLYGSYLIGDKLIAACWAAPTVPYFNNEVCYYIYEDIESHNKSEYQYWQQAGVAGCLLKPIGRMKAGLSKMSGAELLANMFQ